jgi:hypothetical protein
MNDAQPMPNDTTLNEMITSYIALRDKKEAIVKQQREVVKAYDDAMEQIENYLKGLLQTQRLSSLSCDAGVAFVKRKRSATVGDTQVFREHVISTNNFDLCDFRAKPEAVEDYAKEHDGQVPPGVNFRTYDAVQVNRK